MARFARLGACLAAVFMLLCTGPRAEAVFRIWDPVGISFDWHTAQNWDPDGVPANADDVQVSNPGISPILSADTNSVDSLVITAGGLFTNGHRLFIDENNSTGQLTVNGLDNNTPTLNLFPLDGIFEFEPFALRVDRADVLKGGKISFNMSGGDIAAVVDFDMDIGVGGSLTVSGGGTATIEFVRFQSGVIVHQAVFVNDGTLTVGQDSTLHLIGTDATSAGFGLGRVGSTVDIDQGATLILDGLNTDLSNSFGDLRFAGNLSIESEGRFELRNQRGLLGNTEGTFDNRGSISVDGGTIFGENFENFSGTISGAGTIEFDELVNQVQGQITGSHSITTQALENNGVVSGTHAILTQNFDNRGTISPVGGTIDLNVDTLLVHNLDDSTPGILNAIDGDIQLRNVAVGTIAKDGVGVAGGEIRVATGRHFALINSHLVFETGTMAHFAGGGTFDASDSDLTFQSGSKVHFAGGGTLIGGGTQGAITGDALTFDAGSTIEVDAGAEAQIENASTFDNVRLGGNMILNGDLRLVRTVFVENTATGTGNGSLIIDGNAVAVLADGTSFAADVVNEGQLNIEPGSGTGEVQIGAKYTQTSTGALDIHLTDVVANEFDALTVDGNAVLAGTLNVILTPQFDAVVGNTFTILSSTFGLVNNEFATANLPVFNGLTFDLIYNPSSVVLEVIASFTADFDGDGDVDGDDLAQWEGDFGVNDQSDADANDVSDGRDFIVWLEQVGSGLGAVSSSTTAVPEPGAVSLAMAALGLSVGRWRFREKT